ncbi:MAG: hypothetical protein AAF530_13990 [Pseudomonadota bacterium]
MNFLHFVIGGFLTALISFSTLAMAGDGGGGKDPIDLIEDGIVDATPPPDGDPNDPDYEDKLKDWQRDRLKREEIAKDMQDWQDAFNWASGMPQ